MRVAFSRSYSDDGPPPEPKGCLAAVLFILASGVLLTVGIALAW